MGGLSIWHILIVLILLVLLFGRGKITSLMGDIASGIKSFKKGMRDEETPADLAPASLHPPADQGSPAAAPTQKRDTAQG
ncbi:MAG: twin-arginine translocase TatA/TatE family subunit [Alphaproteobacteria bacterium]|nr:twin-arginine translocase TatA/TatE family subunit [Alphaproteobacteria bacterium]